MIKTTLDSGDCIKIFASSGPITTEKDAFFGAVRLIKDHGFLVHHEDGIFDRYHYLAGKTTTRSANVSAILECEKAKAMWATRGGVGALHLLPSLLNIAISPKLLIGFSDTTALFPLFWRQNLAVIHAAGICTLQHWSDLAKEQLFRLLRGDITLEYPITSTNRFATGDSFTGRLLGGNLSVLCSLIGVVPHFLRPDDQPVLLFIEEVNEPTYKIERMLMQLKLSGALANVKALVLGQFTSCDLVKDEASSLSTALARITADLEIPAYMGVEVGHQKNSQALLLGPHYSVDATVLRRIELT